MKLVLTLILGLLIPISSLKIKPSVQLVGPAHAAVPLALAAPVVAIGSLETLLLAVAAAATLGVISNAVAIRYKYEINNSIERIRNASTESWESIKYETVQLFNEVAIAIGLAGTVSCGPEAIIKASTKEKAVPVPRAISKPEICNQSPKDCCKDMMNKFDKLFDRREARINQRAYRIWTGKKTNKRPECCLEWDSLHGAWEVFNSSGKHLGERGCDDMNNDPCAPSTGRGAHASAAPTTHRPRDCAELKSGR